MPYITPGEANAWADKVKLNLTTLDAELEASVAAQVLARVSQAYDASSWTDTATTPALVRKIIAMMYVGWLFQRTYSEEEEVNNYGLMLQAQAERLIEGIVTGQYVLPEVPDSASSSAPLFYPTDVSSALEPTASDRSLGGAKFSMGQIF